MNINIYVEDTLGKYINQHAKHFGISRNAIIREAIKEWVSHHAVKQWPSSILEFTGEKNAPSFESYRDDLLPPNEDPLS